MKREQNKFMENSKFFEGGGRTIEGQKIAGAEWVVSDKKYETENGKLFSNTFVYKRQFGLPYGF